MDFQLNDDDEYIINISSPGSDSMDDMYMDLDEEKENRREEEEKKLETLNRMEDGFPMAVAGPSNANSFKSKKESDSRSIFVGNVDYDATEEELEKHFHGCGQIIRTTIPRDKFRSNTKGFAYIEFASKESVVMAMHLDESLFRGRQIKVMPKRTNKPGISTTNRPPARFMGRGRGRGSFRRGQRRGGASYRRGLPGEKISFYARPRGISKRGRPISRFFRGQLWIQHNVYSLQRAPTSSLA